MKALTEKELKRKAELEKLVQESGVEEELKDMAWNQQDPLLPNDLNVTIPEKYWNYFLLKNQIFDDELNRQKNKAKLAIMDQITKANLDEKMQGETYQKFLEKMNNLWRENK